MRFPVKSGASHRLHRNNIGKYSGQTKKEASFVF